MPQSKKVGNQILQNSDIYWQEDLCCVKLRFKVWVCGLCFRQSENAEVATLVNWLKIFQSCSRCFTSRVQVVGRILGTSSEIVFLNDLLGFLFQKNKCLYHICASKQFYDLGWSCEDLISMCVDNIIHSSIWVYLNWAMHSGWCKGTHVCLAFSAKVLKCQLKVGNT